MQKSETNYNMIDWWKKVVFENYANFSGRARRTEYWYFILGQLCILLPFYILMGVSIELGYELFENLSIAIIILYFIATVIPGLAVTVRRLHDTDKSGWWYFIVLIPFGGVILLVFMLIEGKPFINKYGNDPKRPNQDPMFDFEQSQSPLY